MAILNYIGQGTYSIVDEIYLNRITKNLRWSVIVYSDSTKTTKLAQTDFDVSGRDTLRSVKGILSCPPENPKPFDTWFVSKSELATEAWEGRENLIAVYMPESPYNGWGFWYHTDHEVFYYEPLSLYVRYDQSTGEITPAIVHSDSRIWDKYFAKPDTINQLYLYMHTLPNFKGTVSV